MASSGEKERARLREANEAGVPWRKWGPYLSERQWGTVREDYSGDGNAWDYFSHDQARSRAYRWGEDGLAGLSDDKQTLCFAIALWNGRDPILKERLFGLTNSEGNHGEDVKEYYFYLDSTPTHSYMKYLYKYPQVPYPYGDLVRTNRQRSRDELEYELLDTGIFDQDRYFDVFVEYAKESPEDILIRITACNRGPDPATLHLLPTLWFRNTWSWHEGVGKPSLIQIDSASGASVVAAFHADSVERYLYCEADAPLLFTENETNNERIWDVPNRTPYVKDGINNCVIQGRQDLVHPEKRGTKASAHYVLEIGTEESRVVRLRFTTTAPGALSRTYVEAAGDPLGGHFEEVFALRLRESDDFYDSITPDSLNEDQARVIRQAMAGMLWSKQYYYFDVDHWLEEHQAHPLLAATRSARNQNWFHMVNSDIISMPDKWEYPWYAAWDLAFHTAALAMVDLQFAKEQLDLMLREVYLHPNGQIPAYEWNFGDVNPPVHAWATLFLHSASIQLVGKADIEFLKHAFQKLVMNFTWWVNRKDPTGRNVFEGGFLGLDNIGVFDRSAALPTGGSLEQADGTAWMAMFSQNMLELALELAAHDPVYEELAYKFAEHFLWISGAMDRIGQHRDEMWDEEDGFFYDLLRLPDGSATRLRVRSLVGLLPLCATTVMSRKTRAKFPKLIGRVSTFIRRHPELTANIAPLDRLGFAGRGLLAIVGEQKLRRILSRMLDENEFLGPYGIRSLSKSHRDHPYVFHVGGREYRVDYMPAESNTGMFGGNSNWRGPIWVPVNLLIIRSLLQFFLYYGKEFAVECPTGSGRYLNLFEVTREISRRLANLFLRDENGRRPVYGRCEKFQSDPHWKDCILFYEYFHGDNGAGIGASHQTGWTGTVARLIQMFGHLNADDILEGGFTRPFTALYREG